MAAKVGAASSGRFRRDGIVRGQGRSYADDHHSSHSHFKNFVKVMQEMRDAYDHLHHIFMHDDPFTPAAQEDITSEFEKYRGHMQRLAIETVRKVAEYYIELIRNPLEQHVHPGDWAVVKTQIARKVKDARDREVSRNFHERYAAWQDILDLTEVARGKYSILSD